MFEALLTDQNPHWENTAYEGGAQRHVFPKLLEFMKTNMIISIMGVRRSGKSTILKQMINHLIAKERVAPENILFLNLENPYFSQYTGNIQYLEHAFEDYLSLKSPKGKIYCLLDEVQFFQQWPVFVKARFEQKGIKFIITGSNSQLLSSDLMTLLSGRTLSLEVFPLSFAELADYRNLLSSPHKNRHELKRLFGEYLQIGGFPEVAVGDGHHVATDILSSYAKSILYQDVATRLHARKPIELEKLFVYLISSLGTPFSYSKLSLQFEISDKVLKEYVKAFSEAYLLFELEQFSYSVKQQIRNPKKVYAIDPGLTNAVAFQFSENRGRLLESAIFLELKRLGLELYYYKTERDLEIDFIGKRKSELALIQVSWQLQDPSTKTREIKALVDAATELKKTSGIIITFEEEEEYRESSISIHIVPAYKFLSYSDEKKISLLFGKEMSL